MAFYRDADVALVTPLRDGMNLVAKEFVACQTDENPGVLILSPFAGAGGLMHEALMANPYETLNVANALHRALTMQLDERQLRMNQLKRRERRMDVDAWVRDFLIGMAGIKASSGGPTLQGGWEGIRVEGPSFEQFFRGASNGLSFRQKFIRAPYFLKNVTLNQSI